MFNKSVHINRGVMSHCQTETVTRVLAFTPDEREGEESHWKKKKEIKINSSQSHPNHTTISGVYSDSDSQIFS